MRMSQPWLQVFVAFWIQAIGIGSLLYAYGVVTLPLAEAFQPSRTMLMLGVAVMTLSAGLLSPWLGRTMDRGSLKWLMATGVIAIALGYLLLSFSGAMWQVPIIYALLMSIGYAILGPLAASTLLSRWFSQRRGLALGIAGAGTSFGGFCFPPLIQWFIELHEWRLALRLLAGIVLVSGLPVVLLLTRDRPETPPAPSAPASKARATRRYDSYGAVLGDRNFWVIALAVGILFAVFTATVSNLAAFATDQGASASQAAQLMSLVAIMAIPGTLLFGALADRLDLRVALGLLMGLVVLGMLSFLGHPSPRMLQIGSVMVGIGGGGMIPVWGALLARTFGLLDYGRVMGMMNPLLMLFSLVAPVLAGLLRDLSGSYHTAFLTFAVPLGAAILLLPWIRFQRPGYTPAPAAQ